MSYWWNPSKPDEIKPVPWLHPAAVCYLESLLTPDMSVIEHGCGGSTLWFAERVKIVYCYDNNEEWVKRIRHDNVRRYVYKSGYVLTVGSGDYDLLFIDGNNQDRPHWISAAHDIVKPGGIVVVDNAEREHYQEALAELRKHCHAPTIITAWTGYGKRVETHFYRLKGGEKWI